MQASTPTGAGRRFATFLLTSGLSVIVNLVLRYLLSRVMVFELAVAVAYMFSTAVAFALARLFVFEGARAGGWQAQLGRFVLVNMVGFVQVLAVSAGLLRLAFPAIGLRWHAPEIAHFIGLASLAVTSYQLHRRFSFAPGTPRR